MLQETFLDEGRKRKGGKKERSKEGRKKEEKDPTLFIWYCGTIIITKLRSRANINSCKLHSQRSTDIDTFRGYWMNPLWPTFPSHTEGK